ncbi:hypothetical protein Q669_00510 [Labrenzia sp. C1B10]|uniref:thermonuclease family protein n=1 Tax=unclassified Labrenzia TaxID=2648686 RepID=UPI0003B84781|nr:MULTISPECIES: thermonuclease family protein [unclassified Labrenzia]ERP98772.1 hypothetical protein Q669_00510 [Labrenzia sp. C1B10]ERS00958.1 hypothetical protein Q675_09130 [Labrenzia sp. C1B70]
MALSVFVGTSEDLPIDGMLHELMQWRPEAPTNGSKVITCNSLTAVDGDTIKCDGVNMRDMGDGTPFVSGYDTPELRRPKCQQELELARAAKARMQELLETPGVQVRDSGKVDWYNRPLVWVTLPDGRSVGAVLIDEGLARMWTPQYKANWCP